MRLERRRKYARDWYAHNRKKRLKQNKTWRDANKAQLKASRQASYDPKKQRARFEKWYLSNRQKVVANAKRWRLLNPDKHSNSEWKSVLKRRYGLSVEQYMAMLKRQKGLCAICQKPYSTKRLHVDHCHRNGHVRGLLCARCNLGIGYFADSPRLLKRAAGYVNKRPHD